MAIAIAIALVHGTQAHAASKSDACTGDHGAYTSILCIDDHMTGSGSYIISPNSNYRLYISNGYLAVYNGSTHVFNLYSPTSPSNEIYYVRYEWRFYGKSFVGYNANDQQVWEDADTGGWYVKMDDDGCVRYYFSNDTSTTYAHCG